MKSTNTLVSVILPVYNAEKFLSDAIDSILSQTYTLFELIIIDDGSKDASLDIIKERAKQDSRIAFSSRENKGLTFTLNELISKCNGKYIARMDADDISFPERFALQVDLLEKSKSDICGGHYLAIDEQNKKIDSILVPLCKKSFLVNLSLTVPFAHGSVMMRKDFLDKNKLQYGGRGYHSAEDYDLWSQFLSLGATFCNVDAFIFAYREYATSISKSNTKNLKNDAKKISKNIICQNHKQLEISLEYLSKQSLSKNEIDNVIGTSLYLFLYTRSFIFKKIIRKLPLRNVLTILLKFISGRFF